MRKPLRLLAESLRQFAIGLGPALAMAFVGLAIHVVLMQLLFIGGQALFTPDPELTLDQILANLEEERDWRDDARDVSARTLGMSFFFFPHALVALILTSWLLRRRAGFDGIRVLRRALRGAALLSGATAVVYGAAYFVDDVFPATRYVRFNFDTAAMIGVWFAGTALLLPARLMGHEPVAASGFVKNTLVAALAMVPWFYASEVIGAPLRHCRECGGFFEGGCVFLPVLGAYLLGLTVSSAAVSAAACMRELPTAP